MPCGLSRARHRLLPSPPARRSTRAPDSTSEYERVATCPPVSVSGHLRTQYRRSVLMESRCKVDVMALVVWNGKGESGRDTLGFTSQEGIKGKETVLFSGYACDKDSNPFVESGKATLQ